MQKTTNDIVLFLLVTSLLIVIMATFIVTILYFYRKRQIAYQKDLEKIKSDFEKNILSAQLEIQEHTFENISREIHDHICLNLTLAKLNLITPSSLTKQQLSDRINSAVEILSTSIHELSNISHSMNSDLLESHGLIKVLENEIEKMEHPGLLNIDYNVKGNPVFMNSQKELVIFRIIQEAFNNILKHAKAKNILLELYYNENGIEVIVQDDGLGFMPGHLNQNEKLNAKSGLLNMKKRAKLIDGRCEIVSNPGRGTTIHLSTPY